MKVVTITIPVRVDEEHSDSYVKKLGPVFGLFCKLDANGMPDTEVLVHAHNDATEFKVMTPDDSHSVIDVGAIIDEIERLGLHLVGSVVGCDCGCERPPVHSLCEVKVLKIRHESPVLH